MLELIASRRFRFLLTALIRVAASPQPVSGRHLASMLHCPPRYLEPDLQALVAAGLLTSRRGAGGGYRLAISPHRISLFDILHVIAPEPAQDLAADACRLQREVVYPLLQRVQRDCHRLLEQITLAACVEKGVQAGILEHPPEVPNFSI